MWSWNSKLIKIETFAAKDIFFSSSKNLFYTTLNVIHLCF